MTSVKFFIWDKRTGKLADLTHYETKSKAETAARNLVVLERLANGAWEILSTGQLAAREKGEKPRDNRDAEWGE